MKPGKTQSSVPLECTCLCLDRGDGTFRLVYSTPTAGKAHRLTIACRGIEVRSCSFIVDVGPGRAQNKLPIQETCVESKENDNKFKYQKSGTFTVGGFIEHLWKVTIESYPHLAEIKDSEYINAIINCKTEEEQEMILEQYRSQCSEVKNN